MGEKRWQNQYRDTLVCIDGWEDGVFTGRLSHQTLPEPVAFHGAIQFLLAMENLLNDLQFPEPFSQTRTFTRITPPAGVSAEEAQRGYLATFNLRVLFRQNASWQGSIQWLEGHQETSFRSVLELLLLLNSTVEQARQEKTE